MSFDEESVEDLTRALYQVIEKYLKNVFINGYLLQDATDNGLKDGITFLALKSQIMKHVGLLENLTISIDNWMVPPKPRRISQMFNDFFSSIPYTFSFTYARNNAQLIVFYVFFTIINLGLITSRLWEYRHWKNIDGSRNWYIMIARAGGNSKYHTFSNCTNFALS